MSMTAVPISILRVRAPMAASSGNGELSGRAKWCTRKYAPSMPNSSAAIASSMDWSSESVADRTRDPYESLQCPNDRNPIFFKATLHQDDAYAWLDLNAFRAIGCSVRSMTLAIRVVAGAGWGAHR